MNWKDGKESPATKEFTKIKQEPDEDKKGDSGVPPGLEALFSICKQLYPDQPNPLQVTAFVKYWCV